MDGEIGALVGKALTLRCSPGRGCCVWIGSRVKRRCRRMHRVVSTRLGRRRKSTRMCRDLSRNGREATNGKSTVRRIRGRKATRGCRDLTRNGRKSSIRKKVGIMMGRRATIGERGGTRRSTRR